jgi:integrase
MPTRASEPGIVHTEFGYRAYVRVRGSLYTKRFPKDATKTEMRDWRSGQRTDVLRRHRRDEGAHSAPGTFAADVKTYLEGVRAMPTYAWREKEMALWVAAFGDRPRASITSAEIRAVLARWRTSGKHVIVYERDPRGRRVRNALTNAYTVLREYDAPLSESAVNHRRTALMHFFHVMNGKGGANPVKDIPRLREPDAKPRGLTFAQLRLVFSQMAPSKTKARILVMAHTGLPHATLMRLARADVDYAAKTVLAPRRRKGKGTKTRALPLTRDAVAAFKMLDRYDGWGPFSRDSLRRALALACTKAGVPVIRGYDLRHSFATAVYRASGDIKAVQALLDHSDQKLTDRYTLGAVEDAMRDALTKRKR